MFKQEIKDLSAAQLLNPTVTDKLFAVIELVSSPEKYEKMIQALIEETERNTQSLDDLNLGGDVHSIIEEKEALLEEARDMYLEAETTLKNAEKEAKQNLKLANQKADTIKRDAAHYADRVKKDSQSIKVNREAQELATRKATQLEQDLRRKLREAEQAKLDFDKKMQELKSRFEGL